jgi:hypothetical protein
VSSARGTACKDDQDVIQDVIQDWDAEINSIQENAKLQRWVYAPLANKLSSFKSDGSSWIPSFVQASTQYDIYCNGKWCPGNVTCANMDGAFHTICDVSMSIPLTVYTRLPRRSLHSATLQCVITHQTHALMLGLLLTWM